MPCSQSHPICTLAHTYTSTNVPCSSTGLPMHPPTPYLPTPRSFNANQPIREDVNPTGKALFEKEQEVRRGVISCLLAGLGGWMGGCLHGGMGGCAGCAIAVG